jgi:hypothetical protein
MSRRRVLTRGQLDMIDDAYKMAVETLVITDGEDVTPESVDRLERTVGAVAMLLDRCVSDEARRRAVLLRAGRIPREVTPI